MYLLICIFFNLKTDNNYTYQTSNFNTIEYIYNEKYKI